MNGFKDNEPKKIGTGESESPLAPPPQQKMDMRTMNSDLQSLQNTGGQIAKPYTPASTPVNTASESMFQPPQVETPPPPNIPVEPATISSTGQQKPKIKSGKILWVIIGVIIAVALAAIGYFVIYPALTPIKPIAQQSPPPVTPPEPVIETETPPAPEPNPSSADLLPTITGSHISLFKTPADKVLEINLSEATVDSFRSGISQNITDQNGLYEIKIINSIGQQISPHALLSLLVPKFFNAQTLGYFEENANFFVYVSQNGPWLGYVLKLKNNADIGQAQNRMAALQNDPDNDNLFVLQPGEIGVWRDGKIANRAASLVDFSQPNAALGYVWLEKTLLITTNLQAGEEAAKRLGF